VLGGVKVKHSHQCSASFRTPAEALLDVHRRSKIMQQAIATTLGLHGFQFGLTLCSGFQARAREGIRACLHLVYEAHVEPPLCSSGIFMTTAKADGVGKSSPPVEECRRPPATTTGRHRCPSELGHHRP
jgi:hypothetical protein